MSSGATTRVGHHVLKDLHCVCVVFGMFHEHRESRERRRRAARARHVLRLQDVQDGLHRRVVCGVHVRSKRVVARAPAEPGHVALRRQDQVSEAQSREVHEHVASFANFTFAVLVEHICIEAAVRCQWKNFLTLLAVETVVRRATGGLL